MRRLLEGGLAGSIETSPTPPRSPSDDGTAATISIAGSGGSGEVWSLPYGNMLVGGSGLSGGGLGENGLSGLLGFSVPSSPVTTISAVGTGGLAGPAINKNGHTVTITNNGIITGAINA